MIDLPWLALIVADQTAVATNPAVAFEDRLASFSRPINSLVGGDTRFVPVRPPIVAAFVGQNDFPTKTTVARRSIVVMYRFGGLTMSHKLFSMQLLPIGERQVIEEPNDPLAVRNDVVDN